MAAFSFIEESFTIVPLKKYSLQAKDSISGQHEYIDMSFLTVGEGQKYALLGGTTSTAWAEDLWLTSIRAEMYIDVITIDTRTFPSSLHSFAFTGGASAHIYPKSLACVG